MFRNRHSNKSRSTNYSSIFSEDDPKKLLKKATKFKKRGDFDNAINALKHSYELISKGNIIYSINTFLRLPLYLQKAGRTKEAWKEFNNLLENGYPNQMQKKGIVFIDKANIFNKMRLYLQREKKNAKAIKYGIFSHIAMVRGLYLQKRKSELKNSQSKESIQTMLKSLLKKAKKIGLLEEFTNLVSEEIKNPSKIDSNRTSQKIDKILSKADNA
jgi:hypothetical protein